MRKKAFAYLRVSDRTQVEDKNGKPKDGFIRQLKACEEYAQSHDLTIVQVYREAVSGTKSKDYRPVLAKLMVSLEQNHHGVKIVLIERLDRLARDYFIQEAIIRDFQTKGFTLISANENEPDLCSDDPTRKLLRTFLGGIAEYEKSMLVAKLRASRDRIRAEKGRCEGRNRYIDTEEGIKLVEYIKSLREREPVEWPHIGKRKTLQQIADQLNAEGIKTLSGKEWSMHRVRDITLDR